MKKLLALLSILGLCLALAPAALAGIPGLGPVRTSLLLQNAGSGDAQLQLVWATGPGGGGGRCARGCGRVVRSGRVSEARFASPAPGNARGSALLAT